MFVSHEHARMVDKAIARITELRESATIRIVEVEVEEEAKPPVGGVHRGKLEIELEWEEGSVTGGTASASPSSR